MAAISEWLTCLADQFLGIAFFNGIRIDTDRITDPRWDRVLPILAEEQVLTCRVMLERKLLGRGVKVLDVGTGSGVFAIWVAAHGCDVVAIDNSPRAIKFANYNLSHPDNAARIQAAGGSVRIEGADFLAWAREQPCTFDLVILAPPYNPTAPGVFPARHAEAGPLGQDRFQEQLPLAYHLIGARGKIVGNQMAFHRKNQAEAWWREQIESIDPRALDQCRVSFAPMLALAEYPAKAFMQMQYRYFLDPSLNPEKHQPVQEYIKTSLGKWDDDAVFGLYYYEVEKPAASPSCFVPERFTLPFEVPATWQDRVDLHRRIVEHTSQKNSIPTAALFLHNDFTPPLPDAPTALSATTLDVEPRQRFQASVLRTLLTWILQNRIVGADSAAFDLVLIDIGPWFYSEQGRGAIRNEALLCGGPEFTANVTEMLTRYQRNTKAQQLCRLAPFLHPSFTGASDPSEWGGVNFHAVDDADFDLGLDQDDRLRLSRWAEQIAVKFADLNSMGHSIEGDLVTIGSESIATAYATSSLSELGVASPRDYMLRLEQDYGDAIPPETKDRDLELVHMTFHKRLREIVRPHDDDVFSSALLGMPLSMAFSGADSNDSDLPDNYRGGLWIYAASTNKIGPRQELLLFDLVRLASITAGASISASATRSLIEVERARANTFELLPRDAWTKLVDASQPLFPPGPFHTAKSWYKKHTQSKPIPKRVELTSACEAFLTGLKIDSSWLTFEASLCLARAASRRYSLAVPFVEAMLGHAWNMKFPFPAIKSRRIESCSAKVVVALRYFLHEKPEEVETTSWELTVKDTIVYTLTATYHTTQAAQAAAEVLALTPKMRMQRDNRDTPGEACMFADWLRQEAQLYGPPEQAGRTLTMWWQFVCEWIE